MNNIDRESITQLSTNFDNIPIKQVTDSIKQILINGANETFQKYRPKSNKAGKYPCYTSKARKLTREYRRVRNLNNRNKGNLHAAELRSKSSACRKEVLKIRAISKNKVIKLLCDLKDKSPKQF